MAHPHPALPDHDQFQDAMSNLSSSDRSGDTAWADANGEERVASTGAMPQSVQAAMEQHQEPIPAPEASTLEPDTARSTPTGVASADGLDLHRAVWAGDVPLLQRLLASVGQEAAQQLGTQQDPHGNTPMHVAAMRGDPAVLRVLLDAGFSADAPSAGRWLPIHEAVQAGHGDAACLLARAQVMQRKAAAAAQRAVLVQHLKSLPDFSMQLKWELQSSVPGMGLLLRKYAPHDVYTIWKQGSCLRVDGTLMGLNRDAPGPMAGGSMLPGWLRGHFSLIITSPSGPDGKAGMFFIDRTKKEFVDIKAWKKQVTADAVASAYERLSGLLAEVAAAHGLVEKQSMATRDVRFEPVKGWMWSQATEGIDSVPTKVYDASASVVKLKRFKLPWQLRHDSCWADYLAAPAPRNITLTIPTYPLCSNFWTAAKLEAEEAVEAVREAALAEAQHICSCISSSTAPPPRAPEPVKESESRTAGPDVQRSHVPRGISDDDDDLRARLRPGVSETMPAGCSDGTRSSSDFLSTFTSTNCSAGGACGCTEPGAPAGTDAEEPQPKVLGPAPDQEFTPASLDTAASHVFKPAKRMTGRCWMAEGFPLTLAQLLPLLDAIGVTNPAMAKVSLFMARYGDRNDFPLKVQLQLLFTFSITLAFKRFRLLRTPKAPDGAGSSVPAKRRLWDGLRSVTRSGTSAAALPGDDDLAPDFFAVPEGFTETDTFDSFQLVF